MFWEKEKYFLGKTVRYSVMSGEDGEGYSIGISDGETSVVAKDFTNNFEEAVSLAEHMWNSLVLPISLYEIIEDYFGVIGQP